MVEKLYREYYGRELYLEEDEVENALRLAEVLRNHYDRVVQAFKKFTGVLASAGVA